MSDASRSGRQPATSRSSTAVGARRAVRPMSQLRIALTLPGEVSLGAFQAGAMSALVVALGRINRDGRDDVRLDVMTGTSSGSLTAVLAAHALLNGRDP